MKTADTIILKLGYLSITGMDIIKPFCIKKSGLTYEAFKESLKVPLNFSARYSYGKFNISQRLKH